MGKWVGVGAALVVAMGAQSASAVELFFDNFNAEGGAPSNTTLNYNSFANFTVEDGTVDLIGTPNVYGLTGDIKYVDLDGSTDDAGYLLTRDVFSFSAGDTITLNFVASGNQRADIFANGTSDDDDNLFGGFMFTSPVLFSNVMLTGFTSFQTPTLELLGVRPLVGANDPYSTYSISFQADTAGSFRALVGTGSADSVGPLADNFQITASNVVPEPATWAMMIVGFGFAGAMLRRRRPLGLTA
jgi:hypothetical protein